MLLLNMIVAMSIGWVVVPVATVTGQQEALCKAMKGTYTLQGADRCPDGQWTALVPLLPVARPK